MRTIALVRETGRAGVATRVALVVAMGVAAVSCQSTSSRTVATGSSAPTVVSTSTSSVETSESTAPPASANPEPATSSVDVTNPASNPVYPLKLSADGRYLVDQRDRPWRVQADAAWLMSAQATPEQVDEYLAVRAQQGFNSFYLMAMVHPGGYEVAKDAPRNYRGDPPFATPNDFRTAGASPESERYWEWIDSIIDKAAQRHMVVMFSYTYLGYQGGDQGWYQQVVNQSSRQVLFDWGRWLGQRYKDRANLLWFGLGDYTPEGGSEGSSRTVAIAQGIKAAGATQLFMAESSSPDSLPSEAPDFGPIVDMNSFYGYGPSGGGAVYQTADRAWRVNPPKPAWMEEGTYEFENNTGKFSGQPWDTRRGRYWSVLGGGTAGDGFGSRDVWQWTNIPASLRSAGADDSTYAFQLFGTLPWWSLRPSGTDGGLAGSKLVTSGGGQWGGSDYVTSALTSDHEWLLAYVPVTDQGERSIVVDLAALSAPVRARWFDPTTGTYTAISNGWEYPNSGTHQFETAGRHPDGTDDWLLVLDSTGRP